MPERPSSEPVSTKLQRIAELAGQAPDLVFTTLAHHIDIEFLLEACRRTRTDGAVGVDGRTARDFAENLEENLQSLMNRFKFGSYCAPPVRRVMIPKGDGKSLRPIGVPTFEDEEWNLTPLFWHCHRRIHANRMNVWGRAVKRLNWRIWRGGRRYEDWETTGNDNVRFLGEVELFADAEAA